MPPHAPCVSLPKKDCSIPQALWSASQKHHTCTHTHCWAWTSLCNQRPATTTIPSQVFLLRNITTCAQLHQHRARQYAQGDTLFSDRFFLFWYFFPVLDVFGFQILSLRCTTNASLWGGREGRVVCRQYASVSYFWSFACWALLL